jgi:NDP-sugar pyrophosphorylase family protein
VQSGVTELIINVHYFPEQIIHFLKAHSHFNIRIEISDETGQLLDTGGGLKKAAWFFDTNESFIVHNVDILSDINLKDMIQYHKENNALATLAVRKRESSRYFLFNNELELCGWENRTDSSKVITKPASQLNPYAFSGIHIINPEIFKNLNQTGKFSIVHAYLELAKSNRIKGYNHSSGYWFDIGNQNKLTEANEYFKTI